MPEFKYVAAVEGHMVPRFGTGTFIGASIVRPGEIAWREGEVVAVPLDEWTKHVREYGRIVEAGGLVEKTKADHDAWLKREEAEAQPKQAASEGEGEGSVALEPQPDGVGGNLPPIVEGEQPKELVAAGTTAAPTLVEGGLLVEDTKQDPAATKSPKSKRT